MRTAKDYRDAVSQFSFIIKARHALHCKKRSPEQCVQARAILSVPGVYRCKVFRNITYIQFKGDDLPTRYANSQAAIYFAELNDQGGRKAIIDEIRDEIKLNGAIKVTLNPPPYTRSKTYLRSAKMKAIRAATEARSKNKTVKRKYTKSEEKGLRSGSGKAFMWKNGTENEA